MRGQTTAAVQLAPTALLIVGHADEPEIAALVRASGFEPLRVDTAEVLNGVSAAVGLCVVDLRQNGEAIRIARVIRSQQPGVVVIGIADPARPMAAADAIRAGVFDVLPRPPSARDLEALLSNAREQASLAAAAP